MTETLSDSREVTHMVYLVISSCLLSSRCLFSPTGYLSPSSPPLSLFFSLSLSLQHHGFGVGVAMDGQMLRGTLAASEAGDPDILSFAGQRKI